MGKILIVNDLFNISNRLKQIDNKYFVMFNKNTKKFEIHYKQNSNTLQLVVPYSNLDKRTVNLVLKTRVENKKKLFDEMEKHNIKLEKEKNKKIYEEANFKAKEMINYINTKSDNYNINFEKSYKTKWI